MDYFRFGVTECGTFDIIGIWAGDYYRYGWEDDLGIVFADSNGSLIGAALLKGSGSDSYRHLVKHVNPGTYYRVVF